MKRFLNWYLLTVQKLVYVYSVAFYFFLFFSLVLSRKPDF